MTVLVNTCFSRQPKRKERGTFRWRSVLKLYTCFLYAAPFLSSYHTTGRCGLESSLYQNFLSCL